MRKSFLNLYKKELKENMPLAVVYVILALAWILFLSTRHGRWDDELIFGLSYIPLGLLPIYAMIQGFLSYRSEWKDDTIFAVLSLPVPGWYFTASKFLATMTYFTVLSLVMLGSIWLLSMDLVTSILAEVPAHMGYGWMIQGFIGMYLAGWLSSGLNYLVCQFSYLVSRLFNKFIAVITGLAYLLSYWVLLRVAGWISWAFNWLPDYSMETWSQIYGFTYKYVLSFETAPWIALLVIGVGLAWFGSWLLENVLEV